MRLGIEINILCVCVRAAVYQKHTSLHNVYIFSVAYQDVRHLVQIIYIFYFSFMSRTSVLLYRGTFFEYLCVRPRVRGQSHNTFFLSPARHPQIDVVETHTFVEEDYGFMLLTTTCFFSV